MYMVFWFVVCSQNCTSTTTITNFRTFLLPQKYIPHPFAITPNISSPHIFCLRQPQPYFMPLCICQFCTAHSETIQHVDFVPGHFLLPHWTCRGSGPQTPVVPGSELAKGSLGFDRQKLKTDHKLSKMLKVGGGNRYVDPGHPQRFQFYCTDFLSGCLSVSVSAFTQPLRGSGRNHSFGLNRSPEAAPSPLYGGWSELAKCYIQSALDLTWPLRLSSPS